MSDAGATQFTSEEQEWVDAFLAETTLFLGPDPEIMNNHRMAPRTADEDRLLSGPIDANDLDRVRKRIVAGLDEAFEMMGQTGAAPGAKWGDLTSAVYSSGDLIHISTGGVLAFASVLHYPVRFIRQALDRRPERRRPRRGRVHPQRRPLRQHPQHRPEHDPARVLRRRADRLGGDDHPRGRERRQGARRDAVELRIRLRRRHPDEPVQDRRTRRDPARPANVPARARASGRGGPGHVHRLAAQVAGRHRGRGPQAYLGPGGWYVPGQLLLRFDRRSPACSADTDARPTRWPRSRASTSSSRWRKRRRPGRSTTRR